MALKYFTAKEVRAIVKKEVGKVVAVLKQKWKGGGGDGGSSGGDGKTTKSEVVAYGVIKKLLKNRKRMRVQDEEDPEKGFYCCLCWKQKQSCCCEKKKENEQMVNKAAVKKLEVSHIMAIILLMGLLYHCFFNWFEYLKEKLENFYVRVGIAAVITVTISILLFWVLASLMLKWRILMRRIRNVLFKKKNKKTKEEKKEVGGSIPTTKEQRHHEIHSEEEEEEEEDRTKFVRRKKKQVEEEEAEFAGEIQRDDFDNSESEFKSLSLTLTQGHLI